MAFACPYCGSQHAGTGESYLPAETDEAICQGCGQTMQVGSMRVVPLVDPPRVALTDTVPWERREQLGLWVAWWQTCKASMTMPSTIGMAIGPHTSLGRAYWFAAFTSFVASIVQTLFWFVCWAGISIASQTAVGDPAGFARQQLVGSGVSMLLAVVAPAFLIALSAAPAHLFLMITGARRGTFRVTANAVLYGQGPMLLALIPICGGQVGGIWSIVATILILIHAQGVSGWRATLAVLWWLLLLLLLLMVVVGVVVVVAVVAAMA
ncbi:MAG: hypothetical protein V3U29_08845 [Phycisphaeraceae bacterium]